MFSNNSNTFALNYQPHLFHIKANAFFPHEDYSVCTKIIVGLNIRSIFIYNWPRRSLDAERSTNVRGHAQSPGPLELPGHMVCACECPPSLLFSWGPGLSCGASGPPSSGGRCLRWLLAGHPGRTSIHVIHLHGPGAEHPPAKASFLVGFDFQSLSQLLRSNFLSTCLRRQLFNKKQDARRVV